MNNDALVAALGMDAVGAVHGYRLAVLAEAHARGLEPVGAPLSQVVQRPDGAHVVDPVDIRLRLTVPHGAGVAGRALSWCPATGWSACDDTSSAPRFLAPVSAVPLDLMPTPAEVLDWACAAPLDGPDRAPVGVELDDDPQAIVRLLGFLDPGRRARMHEDFAPAPIR